MSFVRMKSSIICPLVSVVMLRHIELCALKSPTKIKRFRELFHEFLHVSNGYLCMRREVYGAYGQGFK